MEAKFVVDPKMVENDELIKNLKNSIVVIQTDVLYAPIDPAVASRIKWSLSWKYKFDWNKRSARPYSNTHCDHLSCRFSPTSFVPF